MNRFLLATLLLLSSLRPALAQRLVTQTATLAAGQGVALELKYAYHIRVRPGAGPHLTVRAQVDIADAELAKTYDLTVATTSTEVTVKEKLDKELLARAWKHNWPDGHHSDDDKDDKVLRIDYEVTLPAATALRIETISGDIDAENLAGAVTLKSIGGDLKLAELSGAVNARAINGDIQLTNLPGRALVDSESISGNVDVTLPPSAKVSLSMRSISGKIYTDFNLSPASSNGLRHVGGQTVEGRANGGGIALLISTISGNIFVRKSK